MPQVLPAKIIDKHKKKKKKKKRPEFARILPEFCPNSYIGNFLGGAPPAPPPPLVSYAYESWIRVYNSCKHDNHPHLGCESWGGGALSSHWLPTKYQHFGISYKVCNRTERRTSGILYTFLSWRRIIVIWRDKYSFWYVKNFESGAGSPPPPPPRPPWGATIKPLTTNQISNFGDFWSIGH